MLMSGNSNGSYVINCYDFTGQLLSTWKCADRNHYTRPAVVANQIVVPNPLQRRLTVYSLTGEVIKHITRLPIANSSAYQGMAVCAVDSNSVVVTRFPESLVFKVNIETGKTMWTCRDVPKPQGVAVYSKEYVCVVSQGNLSFINTATG